MSGQTDKLKGKIKTQVGKVTGNKRLENEGRIDEGKGQVKEWIDKSGAALKKTLPQNKSPSEGRL
jgi:uncharacterized protein YjbJ (UPF0337 family)